LSAIVMENRRSTLAHGIGLGAHVNHREAPRNAIARLPAEERLEERASNRTVLSVI
jgi:hypothetical protein